MKKNPAYLNYDALELYSCVFYGPLLPLYLWLHVPHSWGAVIILLHGPFALDNVAETAHCDSFHCGWAPSSKHSCPSSLLAVEATDSLSSGVLRLLWHAIPWPSTWPRGMWNHCSHAIPLLPWLLIQSFVSGLEVWCFLPLPNGTMAD